MNETQKCMYLLKQYRYILTKQQKNTFKGQILSGDTEGFKKGLQKVINQKQYKIKLARNS